jgi:hypothetical protein
METTMQDPREPVWQGFYGPIEAAQAAIATVYADPRVGVRVPPPKGEVLPNPIAVGPDGEDWMFAVQTRAGAPVPTPAGMKRADPVMVGRMVGA